MKEPQDRKRSIADIRKLAKPVEKSVTVCVAGDLNSQVEELERELLAETKKVSATLASSSEERRIAEEIQALRAEMEDSEVTFTFRALSSRAWSDLMAEHPARKDKEEAWNVDTLPSALIAASCIEPEMTLEDADALADLLNNGQFGELFNCAWTCSNKSLDVPFSVLASRVLRSSEAS